MARKLALGSLAGALIVVGAARAQEAFEFQVFEVSEGEVVEAAEEPVSEAAPAASSDRLKGLKKLKFDRRPSAILKAWATPPPEPKEPAPEPDAAASGAEGTPATPEQAAAGDGEAAVAPAADAPAADAPAADAPAEGAAEDAAADAAGGDEAAGGEEDAKAAKAAAKAAEKAAKEAAKAAEKAAEEARKAAEAAALEAELAAFQRNVTLGAWDAVREYLAGITEEEAQAGYNQLLKSLVDGPPKPQGRFSQWAEKNYFAPPDIVGIAAAARGELKPEQLVQLGALLKQCVDAGGLLERCVERFDEALAAGGFALSSAAVARVVIEAGYPIEAGRFLPSLEEAGDDRVVLNLLARHHVAMHEKEKKTEHLETAWQATQAALAAGEIEEADKEEALRRAVDLAPKVREELGAAWLDQSFTERPERGMEILLTIGSAVARNLMESGQDADARLRTLELQETAAGALLAAAPERAAQWRAALSVLAQNWLTEAVYTYKKDTSTQRGPNVNRDVFGNIFYSYDDETGVWTTGRNQNEPAPIATRKMLAIRPSDAWLELVDDGLRPKIAMVVAQLLLKMQEEAEAFPYIERLAQARPEIAEELAGEFLRVWAKNHNPNTDTNRTNPYIYFYGFEERANAIPLTRSKQDRNLAELAQWLERIEALPIDDVDQKLVAEAFTAAHSTAEVFRVETIESVFGALDELDPKTLAALVQTMRRNLVGVWRDPAVQKEKKTKRRQKDIQNEVLRGYEVAGDVVQRGLGDFPDDWSLLLARAAVMHDENNYRGELERSSEFAPRRAEAFDAFALAAERYCAAAPGLREEEEDADVFLTWFYASLGACDLDAIDHKMQAVDAEIARVRAALDSLPPGSAERHREKIATSIFARMSSVNPAVKFRYVRAGLEIVGDHELARDARDVYEYYRDLVGEIRLQTRIDGGAHVGREQPFGLFVDLAHTREIEREAGGFAKYLVNQNNQAFAWNYGRPTENYRDKFEEAAREALSEHFEVLSITFNHPDTHSRAADEYGWRVTPYAYLLLKPRGAEVDRVPPLRLDLDFLDTSGYAVLPIESAPLPIDASPLERPERRWRSLEVVQTLDERRAAEGKLLLEVKARAFGLVPELDEFLALKSDGFEIVKTDDQGVSVSKFDDEGEGIEIVSERMWTIAMQGAEGLAELPSEFHFGTPLTDGVKMEYQRYHDADLESVTPVVALAERYGERSLAWLAAPVAGAIALAGLLVAGVLYLRRARRHGAGEQAFRVPESVSPFTVLGLLREIEAEGGVPEHERGALAEEIGRLERCYFQDGGVGAPDLHALAAGWVRRAR